MPVDEWLAELQEALGLEDEIDIEAILDVAREVAHRVERKAAPVTTFLVGLAAGRAGEGAAAAIEKTLALAQNRPA